MMSRMLIGGLGLSITLIAFLVPLSTWVLSRVEFREGLEIIAEELNLTASELYRAPLHDYVTPGIENMYLTTVIAGIIGVATVTLLSLLTLRVIKSWKGVRR